MIGPDAFLGGKAEQLAALTARHALPATHSLRQFVDAGGLSSYSGSVTEPYRLAGIYTGRILKGEKPGELPVQQATKYRADHQPQDRQDARPHRAADAACGRRRGHRMIARREFITLLGGAAATWPIVAHAQQSERIGVLMQLAESDPEDQARIGAFREGLAKLGWTEGRNIRIDMRWAASDPGRLRTYAAELVGLKPDLILASGTPALSALQRETRTLPIVFAQVVDPVGAGFVASLARPGGNITGFSQYEYAIAVKWLELLKQIAPGVTRVAVIYEANLTAIGQLREIEAVLPAFGVQLTKAPVRDAAEIQGAIDDFVREPNGGLIVFGGPTTTAHRDVILALAARHRLPNVSGGGRIWAAAGGLASYGVDVRDLYRRSADYVDRILKGAKPADLPVQQATKFELVINLKTAKLLNLDPPITLLARTDEVIE